MAEVVAVAPAPVEAPDECFAVYGADGTPAENSSFVIAPRPRRAAAAIADPVNALALAAPRLLLTAARAVNGNLAVRPKAQFESAFNILTGNARSATSRPPTGPTASSPAAPSSPA